MCMIAPSPIECSVRSGTGVIIEMRIFVGVCFLRQHMAQRHTGKMAGLGIERAATCVPHGVPLTFLSTGAAVWQQNRRLLSRAIATSTSSSPLSPFRQRQTVISRRITRACILPEQPAQRPRLEPQKKSQFNVRVRRQPFSTSSRSGNSDVIEGGDLDDTTTGDGENEEEDGSIKLREIDLEEQFIRGSGPGGQKINKSSVCVVRLFLNGGTLNSFHSVKKTEWCAFIEKTDCVGEKKKLG